MTRRNLPALDFGPMRDDSLPPRDVKLVGLLVQNALFKLSQQLQPLFRVRRSALLVIEIVEHAILISPIVERALIGAEKFLQLEIGLIHEITSKVNACIIVSLAQIVEVRSLFLLDVVDVETNLTPLIDEVDSCDLIGLFDVAVLKREGKSLRNPSLLKQALRLFPGGLDIFPKS